jgi:hypothetical protein
MIYAPKEAVDHALEIATRILSRDKNRNCDVSKIRLRIRYLAYGALHRAFPRAPKGSTARAVGFSEGEVYETHQRYSSMKWNARSNERGKKVNGGRWWSQAREDKVFAAIARFEAATEPWAPEAQEKAPPPSPAIRFVEASAKPPYELAGRRFFIGAGRARRHIVDLGDMPPPGRSALDQLRARK